MTVRLGTGVIALQQAMNSVVERYHWFILGLVNLAVMVISAYAYLKVVLAMYGEEPEEGAPTYKVPVGARIALVLAVAATLGFGLAPAPLTDAARTAVSSLVDPPPVAEELPFTIGG